MAPKDDRSAYLELLRLLEEHPHYSQRELSGRLGLSLGKTHYLLRALLEKGWVKAQNFQRSNRKLGYLYVLTPTGISQRLALAQAFLVRKEHEYRLLRSEIDALRREINESDREAASPHTNVQASQE